MPSVPLKRVPFPLWCNVSPASIINTNKILFYGLNGWNTWKIKFWIQLWIISMRRKRRDVVRNKLAAQRAPANSAFLMNPQSWWQDKHQQWIQKGVSDTWINSWGKQKSSRSSLLKEKKTTKNKGPWVERRRKNTGKACSCRKINVILRDNGKIERRQNFLTQIDPPSAFIFQRKNHCQQPCYQEILFLFLSYGIWFE